MIFELEKGSNMQLEKRCWILLLIVVFLAGCAHTSVPKQIPPLDLSVVDKYQENLSVELINDQPNATPVIYAGVGGYTYYANYNEWTQFFIDCYTEELVKRDVLVSKDSPNKLKIKLSNFSFIQGWAKVRANIVVQLSSGNGEWSKTYEETDTSGWSGGRAFGSVIYHTIEKFLKDPEVIDKMKHP